MNSVAELDIQEFSSLTWYPGIPLLNLISRNLAAELDIQHLTTKFDIQEFSYWNRYPGIQLLNLISRNSATEIDILEFSCWTWYPGIQLLNLISRNSVIEIDIQKTNFKDESGSTSKKNWVFTTNSNFLITYYYVELRLFNLTEFYTLKYLSSTTLRCKDKGIRKSEFL